MEDSKSQEEVTIIDKDESADKNSKLSFVPEDYGKREAAPTPSTRLRPKPVPKAEDPSLPPGHARCEFCSIVGEAETFLAPSRRFCTVTCCKRYSAEKRYYPYGRDEEGVAMSIRQGLVNRHRTLRPNSAKPRKQQSQQPASREERRRRLAYYASGSANATPTDAMPINRKRGRKPGSSNSTPSHMPAGERSTSFVEPYVHPLGAYLNQWTVEEVGEFLTYLGYEAYIDKFQEHEIDGKALSLVKDHHLLMTLKLRLGPTLKIIEHVNLLKLIEELEE